MKKLTWLLLAAALLVPAAASADVNKELEKQRTKEYKSKMKEYKKENWKLLGSTRSMEMTLLEHYDKLNRLGDDGRVIAGIATNVKSKNVGKQMATNNACIQYAQECGSSLKGRVISDMSGDATTGEAEFDHFYGAYERLVEKEIKGVMQESYSVIRENGDGTYEVQTYFIVNESAASAARLRALDDAMKESELARKNGQKISDFVRQGVFN